MDNRQLAIDVLPLIQAVANGKQLQYLNNEWDDIELTGDVFINPELYRIKPEPKYRPFKTTKECWEEMKKHKPYGWVKDASKMYNITIIRDDGIIVNTSIDGGLYNFESSLNLKFVDGAPFGIIED